MNYANDLARAFDAIEQATWLSKDEYVEYLRLFHDYEQEKSDSLTQLVKLVGAQDEDISSGWVSTRGLGSLALTAIRERVPCIRDGDPNLGLGDWMDREMQLFESLKGDKFLAARRNLIQLKQQTIEATSVLNDKWNEFYEANQSANSEISTKLDAYKEKLVSWLEVGGKASDALSNAMSGDHALLGPALSLLTAAGEMARSTRPVLEDWALKMQAKRPNWEMLNTLNEFQAKILEQVDPDIIRRISEDAKFDDVSGSDDFKSFAQDARDMLLKTHYQDAVSASDVYRKAANEKFADRSDSTLENITQRDALGKRWRELQDIQSQLESGPLKTADGSLDKMRDGPQKDQAAEAIKEVREELTRQIADGTKDLEEYSSEADKLK